MEQSPHADEGARTFVLKFGSFFLVHEDAKRESTPDEENRFAQRTSEVLLSTARSSPLVTKIIDEGMADGSWWFEIERDNRSGMASGILGHVVFEANWPARNWSPLARRPVPERLIISVNGVMYAVAGEITSGPPFEDSFEMGRQAQACLEAIYGQVAGCFIRNVGPTPMSPTVYFTYRPGTENRHITVLDNEEVVIDVTDSEGGDIEEFLVEVVGRDADWAVVEHYGAILERESFMEKDVQISSSLADCFSLQKQLWGKRGWTPARWLERGVIRRKLREQLSLLYEAHADAAESVNGLRKAIRESHDSFSSAYFLAHCATYTEKQVADCMDWDDSHVLQAARFLEDDLRANSLEQLTLTAAVAGGVAGGIAGAFLSRI